MGRLDGKTVIITGGNSGVGAATAKRFAAEGADVVISARRVEALESVAKEIEEANGKVLAVKCDISKDEDCKAVVAKTIETFGKVDVLVNNAGVLDKGLKGIATYSDDELDQIVQINQKGTMQMIRATLPQMKAGSAIANVASVAGYNGGGGAAYVSSKGAVIAITKHIGLTYANKGIRCNCICPGTILTPMTATMDPATLDPTVMYPMSLHGDLQGCPPCTADDIANILLFLASDESKPITGQAIVTDYGVNL